ncbi:MAG: ribosomal protein S18-alanine N-acetyltransferase [Endozoicomonadaceae bacterium]|nr:ribosomal protein S18-alanine N-acetyltransferase [Endozoicomonadaceae bacterium]
MSALLYRAMQLADCAVITQILSSINPWYLPVWQDNLSLYHCRVLLLNDHLVGVIVILNMIEEADIIYFAIQPNMQRKGLGRYLLQSALNELSQQRIKTVFLEVNASNYAAQSLYHHFDFVQIGLRENYYTIGSHKENAFIFSLILS